jgi:phage shock protein PspC (stress-responsive transcriptional regulator)
MKTMSFLDQTNLFTREDTFFGVCQGLGEDLGISGNWFRLAFALGLFFSPIGTLAAYAAAGAFVFTIRWLVPNGSKAAAKTETPAAVQTPVQPEPLPLAA